MYPIFSDSLKINIKFHSVTNSTTILIKFDLNVKATSQEPRPTLVGLCFSEQSKFSSSLLTTVLLLKQILLIANPKTPATSKKTTAVWIYIVSVLGGLALLALAGIALYKVSKLNLRQRLKSGVTSENCMYQFRV